MSEETKEELVEDEELKDANGGRRYYAHYSQYCMNCHIYYDFESVCCPKCGATLVKKLKH